MSIKAWINLLIIPAIIFLLIITTNIPIDIHAPAMPIIVKQLGISVTHSQLTISIFLLGYAISPIFYGALSDAYGRRKVVMVALVILIIGSLLCSLATSAAALLIGRFIQGAGSAGTMCLSRSILRDNYHQRSMAQVSSLIGIGVEISLACSPVIGGFLVDSFGWHSNFIFVLLLAVLTLGVVFFLLKETNQHTNKNAIKIVNLYQNSKTILKDPTFIRYALGSAAAFSSAMAYFTISPFVIQDYLHYSAKMYGLFSLIVTGAIIAGSFLNAYLIKRISVPSMVTFGLIFLFLSGILFLILSLTLPVSLTMFIIPSSFAFFALAFLFGNCISGGLTPFPKQAGIASSLYSMFQITVGFVVTGLISLLPKNDGVLLACVFLITSGLALWGFVQKR